MSAYLSAVTADAPTHYWRAADPGGALLHSIGSAGDIVLLVATAFNPLGYSGPVSDGGSCSFDANIGSWHQSGDAFSSPQTIECWVFRHQLAGIQETFLSVNDQLGVLASGQPFFAYQGGFVNATAVLTEMTWHHLVGTFGVAGGAILYVDGVNRAAAGFPGGWGPVTKTESIGMSATGTQLARANIAECARYATELSAARVLAHFNAADNVAQPPVYGAAGGNSGAALSAIYSGLDQDILRSVRKTF